MQILLILSGFISPGFLISTAILCLASPLFAGDAVAIGYNKESVWTGVTYYASSKPKGGKDYKTENGAREEAMRDLRKRSSYAASTVKILSSSDSTGFVAVARAKDKSGKDINVVGRGKSQADADEQAIAQLNQAGASTEQKIVYRYFSYGADSVAKP
jgi:hypothetical protein